MCYILTIVLRAMKFHISEEENEKCGVEGERTPNWPHSYGVLTGIRQGGMRPGLLYRAALEGATFSLVNGERLPVSVLLSEHPPGVCPC